jgi:hypothetical protein
MSGRGSKHSALSSTRFPLRPQNRGELESRSRVVLPSGRDVFYVAGLYSGTEGEANVLDNSHTRGNLHRTGNQRLPAGRVLIHDTPVEIARRLVDRGAIACQAYGRLEPVACRLPSHPSPVDRKIMGVSFAAKLRHGSTRTCSAAWSRCAHWRCVCVPSPSTRSDHRKCGNAIGRARTYTDATRSFSGRLWNRAF